jgi:hypothetical protein
MTAFIFDETDAHRFAELTKQYPLWKIGQMNNCCPHTVWKTIKRHGLSVHDRGEKKRQSFIDDWNDGMDMNQLMWKHGIPSINAVYQKVWLLRRDGRHLEKRKSGARLFTDKEQQEYINDWNNGVSIEQILEKYSLRRKDDVYQKNWRLRKSGIFLVNRGKGKCTTVSTATSSLKNQ